MAEELSKRNARAAESILENERLTADLNDDAASVLLKWGLACAENIVQDTSGMNDLQAEEVMYRPMRALRRMMRAVNKWVNRYDTYSAEDHAESLERIITQARLIYGEDYTPPDDDQQREFQMRLDELRANIPNMITQLRTFVENRASDFDYKGEQYG